MKRFKLRTMQSKTPILYTKSLDRGYGIDLAAAGGLKKIGIHGASPSAALSSGPTKLSHLGDLNAEGSYEIPVHCHGENILGGEELAEYVLKVAEGSGYINANVNANNILSFTSRSNKTLLPTGRLRGAENEIFTIMFKFSAPENAGGTLTTTGLVYLYNSGNQAITYSGSYGGDTVQVVRSSNAARQLLNLNISTTSQKLRTINLSTFGIFRGTVDVTDFAPYWGEMKSFYLSEPLRSFGDTEDVAYPMQGYAVRKIRSMAFTPTSAEVVQLGSDFPTYRIMLPEALWEKELRPDHFTPAESESALIASEFGYMRASDGKSLLFTASESYSTSASFLNFFNSLGIHLEYKAKDPVTERFTPISLATRAGRNYIDLMTATTPGTIEFTYT